MIFSFASAIALAVQTTPATPVERPAVVTTVVATPAPVAPTVTLPHDTPIELMATVEVSTANVSAGSRFKLRVNKPVEVDGRVIIPVGAWAIGEVTSASDAGGLGKSGKMTAHLLYLEYQGAQIPLEGDVKEKGRGAGSAVSAVLLGGWIGLFHRGNNAKIKAGETVVGFVSADVVLDVSGPTAKVVSVTPVAPAPVAVAEPAAATK